MTTWIGFLTSEVPEGDVPGARHDIVLEGKGRAFRVVEIDDAGTPDELAARFATGAIPMRCVINRHFADEGV